MKWFSKLSTLEVLLLTTSVILAIVYAYYFILIPQSWSLMDDYNYARLWGENFHPWSAFITFMQDLMGQGRFRPVDALYRIVRYGFMPVTPRSFHILQFSIAIISLGALVIFLKKVGLTLVEMMLVVLLVLSNLAFKEGLIYTTAAESFAMMFFLISLALHQYQKKWLASLFFIVSILSKESFFVFVTVFLVLEYFEYKNDRKRFRFNYAIILSGLVLGFILFIKSLPQTYSSGLSLYKIQVLGTVKAFLLPLIKSFAPAILLIGIAIWNRKKLNLNVQRMKVACVGCTIAVMYTLLLAAWGPFDSWFYLHIPIPFGWAMVLGALWQPSKKLHVNEFLGLVLVLVFSVVATVNGARNLTLYLEGAKKIADVACEEYSRNNNLKIYSNCNEGSGQLQEYLMQSKRCPKAPKIGYLNGAAVVPGSIHQPYLLILSSKCDFFHFAEENYQYAFDLKYWTVLKKL